MTGLMKVIGTLAVALVCVWLAIFALDLVLDISHSLFSWLRYKLFPFLTYAVIFGAIIYGLNRMFHNA